MKMVQKYNKQDKIQLVFNWDLTEPERSAINVMVEHFEGVRVKFNWKDTRTLEYIL